VKYLGSLAAPWLSEWLVLWECGLSVAVANGSRMTRAMHVILRLLFGNQGMPRLSPWLACGLSISCRCGCSPLGLHRVASVPGLSMSHLTKPRDSKIPSPGIYFRNSWCLFHSERLTEPENPRHGPAGPARPECRVAVAAAECSRGTASEVTTPVNRLGPWLRLDRWGTLLYRYRIKGDTVRRTPSRST